MGGKKVMPFLQEFFGSRDNQDELVRKLEASGFTLDTSSTIPLYRANGAEVNIQPITDRSKHIAGANIVPWGFVLQLGRSLGKYYSGHPLRTFFASLDEPTAYGIMGLKPKYVAQAYLP